MAEKKQQQKKYHVTPGITSFTFNGEPVNVGKTATFECTPEEAVDLINQGILVMGVADTSKKAGRDMGNPPVVETPKEEAGKEIPPEALAVAKETKAKSAKSE